MAANPNTIVLQETWDKVYQITHHKMPVYPAISNFRLQSGLEKNDIVNRQYPSTFVAFPMAGDGGYTRQTLTDTKEQLTINREKETSFYLKELDEIQSHLPTRTKYAYQATAAIFHQVDADVLGNYDQFTNDLDDGSLGGTADNGILVDASNVAKVFSGSTKLLQRGNVMIDNVARFTGFKSEDDKNPMAVAIISPDVYQIIIQRLEGKDNVLGERVGVQGHAGMYMGYNLFVSNALGYSAKLLMGTQATDGDTVTVNGVVFTFKTTLGTTAGNILIGASAAASADAVVAVINDSENLANFNGGAGPSTAGTLYVELLQANRNLLINTAATDNTTNVTIKAKGAGFFAVSETLTAAADVWTPALQIQHCLLGVANSIDVVLAKTPGLKVKDRDGKIGSDLVTWAAYGEKVFNEGKAKMIDVKVRTSAY